MPCTFIALELNTFAILFKEIIIDNKPLTLVEAVELLQSRGVEVQAATLKKYAAGTYNPPLKAWKAGKTWLAYPDDVIEWAGAYKAAPPRGQRKRKG